MKLFEPFVLKGRTVKNRIGLPAMVCYDRTGSDGYVTQKSIDHYAAIARGGVGLISTEACCIDPKGKVCDCALGIWEDGQIAGLSEIVKAVHAENVPIVIQVQHSGLVGYGNTVPPLNYLPEGMAPYTAKYGSTVKTKGPSEYSCVFPFDGMRREASELSTDEIHALRDMFTRSCVRAYKAGADGVELHACHYYLISQFLNSHINRRLDEYGKPELFCDEIIRSVRQATSDDFIIGVRLGIFEPTLADGIRNAIALERAGADYFHMSYGFALESVEEKPEGYPFNQYVYGAEMIKKNVSAPVFAVNGIDSPELAENILQNTGVDMCFVGTGQLVNYNWANDAKSGRDTGKCLHCPFCQWRAHPSKCAGRRAFERKTSVL